MSSRIVLFGSTGFVGSHIKDVLSDVDLYCPEWPKYDLGKPETVGRLLRPGDIVINAAGYANATDTTPRGLALFKSANVDGVRNLADICAKANAAQLVHISSVAAMGRLHSENITEDMSVPVCSPYAESKLEGEKILAEYSGIIPVTILRPTSVFGEKRGLAGTLCKFVAKGTVPLPGGGRALVPFTYIGNIAHAVSLAAGNEKCFGKTFIIGDEQSYTLRDIIMQIAKSMAVEPRIISVPVPIALAGAIGFELLAALKKSSPLLDRGRLDTMTNSVSYSIKSFKEATGYRQLFTFEESVDKIVRWYQAQEQ